MTPPTPSRAEWSAATGEAFERLRRAGLTIVRNQSLAPFTTYRVGGPAAGFLSVTSVSELETVRSVTSTSELAILVVGNGSNLLIADRGFDGLVLHLSESFDEISIGQPSAGAGR
ncbi:MAG: hypothetical protein O3C27_07805, partial [Actinomycetota bacterium]|nr:hypothetical protein [Actinomycetota bacterium]